MFGLIDYQKDFTVKLKLNNLISDCDQTTNWEYLEAQQAEQVLVDECLNAFILLTSACETPYQFCAAACLHPGFAFRKPLENFT